MKAPSDKFQYPITKPELVKEIIHGVGVVDPYRWLEDADSPKVKAWFKQQNKLTDQWLVKTDVETVYEELKQDMDVSSKSLPWRAGTSYFWYERKPGQDHAVLFSGSSFYAKQKKLVIDPNKLSDDGSVALNWFVISNDGKFAVYSLQESGTERQQIYIYDMKTGKGEEFYFGRDFSMCWGDNSEGFYYIRSNYQEHGGDLTDETHYKQAHYHRLGDDRIEDQLLFNAIDYLPKEAGIGAHGSEDDRYVIINVSIGWSKRKIYIIDRQTDETLELMADIKAIHYCSIVDEYLYLTTNHQANNLKVLRIKLKDATKPLKEWEEFIPEKIGYNLEQWYVSKSQIIVEYIHNVTSVVARFERNSGRYIGDISLPPISSLASLNAHEDHDEFFYSVTSFLSPAIRYRYDPKTKRSKAIWKDPRSIDSKRFKAEQVWYKSKDGTDIPMFIIGPKTRSKQGHPAIIYGYGGFALGEYPGFLGGYKPWFDRGGVFVMPNLRGGGEFGEAWHRAGMLESKQNTFDDMIMAAEYVCQQNITSPQQLAIFGGSNGGLLVGACITQRPDLFGAAVCAVPLLDMLRYHKFLLAHRWTHEYGSPDDPKEFKWLYAYSPYHHIDLKKQYPAVLFTAGLNDSRVHPLHAWKMTARMQAGSSNNIVLARTEVKAGHGPGKGFYQSIYDWAEQLVFMMRSLEVKI